MKKVISIILILLVITGCANNKACNDSDAIKFKKEYESLNGKKNNGTEYVKVKIDEDNSMKYAKYDDVINLIKNGTGVIYFGFPECPWCRNAVPVLIDAANELGIDKIYYFNALSMRDKKVLENGEVITEKEGTEEYKELVNLLYNDLPLYDGLNDDTIKRLYFPTVLFVKDGKVIYLHTSTVESQENPLIKLDKKQYKELKDIYLKYLNKVFEIVCDDAC